MAMEFQEFWYSNNKQKHFIEIFDHDVTWSKKKFIIKYGDIYLFSKLAFWQQKLIVGRYSQIKQVKKCAKQFFISKHSEKDVIFLQRYVTKSKCFISFYKGKSTIYNYIDTKINNNSTWSKSSRIKL